MFVSFCFFFFSSRRRHTRSDRDWSPDVCSSDLLEAYGAAKARIFENQTESDCAVVNADDPAARPYAPTKPQVFWFSRKQRVAQGALVRENEIVFRQDGKDEFVMKLQDIPLAGAHNVENVLAAVTAARLAGAQAAEIASGVRSFAGVEHRLEFVAEIGGVRYYNDSKATNVDATIKALDAFSGRILIVLGGKDKGSDYTALQKPLREKAILALLIGAAADKIEKQITGSVAIERGATRRRGAPGPGMRQLRSVSELRTPRPRL